MNTTILVFSLISSLTILILFLFLNLQKTWIGKLEKRIEPKKNVIHIHGKSDTVFPIKNIISPYIEIPGDHAIILTQYKWFNKNLPGIIQ